MTRKTSLNKLDAITRRLKPTDRLIVIPSWGDTVFIDGQKVPRSEYKPDPGAKVINIDWGYEL